MKSKRGAAGDGCAVKTPEEKLQAEAEEFKRKQAAERQRSRRAGKKTYPVQLNKSDVEKLVSWGYVPACADDRDVGAAIAKIVARGIYYARPALPAETAVDLSRRAEGPKAKGGFRRKKDPGRILTGAEKARVAAQIMAEEERRRIAEEDRRRFEADLADARAALPATYHTESIHERAARLERERKEVVAAYRASVADLPQAPKARAFQPLGKSGISKKGGKPVTNGFGSHQFPESQADTVKPIRMKARAADVKRFARIMPPDDSVHTLQATNAELREMYSSRGSHERD